MVNCSVAVSSEGSDKLDHCCLDYPNQLKSQQVFELESYKDEVQAGIILMMG